MNFHLTVITGASRGLGLALAQQLLAPDAKLLCISRTSNPALQHQASAVGCKLEQWNADLTAPATVVRQLEGWLHAHARDKPASATLINNAAVLAPAVPLRASAAEDLALALRVGLEAPMLLCSAFLRSTQDWQIDRRVLNISSGLGRRAMASSAAYCASKAGMDHFTRCMALDEAREPFGARVCSLAPGVIDTDMQVQLRSADALQFPDRDAFAGMHAKGQLSSPAQTAQQVLHYLRRADFGVNTVADVRDAA